MSNVRPLADLLGQPVLFDAFLYTWRARPAYMEVCLKTVDILAYDNARRIRRVDHAWIRVDHDVWGGFLECHQLAKKGFTLNQPVRGAAKIIQYRRKDQTQDYGLEQKGFFGTEDMKRWQLRHITRPNHRDRLARALAGMDTQTLRSLEASLSLIIQGIEECREDWRSNGKTPRDAITNVRTQLSMAKTQLKQREAHEDLALNEIWAASIRVNLPPVAGQKNLPKITRNSCHFGQSGL